MPLFTQVRGETVWKIAEGVSSTLLWRQEAADRDFFDPSWPLRSPDSGSIPNFQTVSEGEFSEVRGSQASMALCSSEESVGPTSKRDPRKEAPNNAHHHRPVNSRFSNASCGRWAGFGAALILHRAPQATQRRGRLYLRRLGCRLRRAFRAHAYRRLGKMKRGRGPNY